MYEENLCFFSRSCIKFILNTLNILISDIFKRWFLGKILPNQAIHILILAELSQSEISLLVLNKKFDTFVVRLYDPKRNLFWET